jgi:hypothetical protein
VNRSRNARCRLLPLACTGNRPVADLSVIISLVAARCKFSREKIFTIFADDLITAKRNLVINTDKNKKSESEIVFTQFKNLTKKIKYVYNEKNRGLEKLYENQKKENTVEVSMLDKRRFDNGVYEYRDLNNELLYGLYYADKTKKEFLVNNKGVYMYTINSF